MGFGKSGQFKSIGNIWKYLRDGLGLSVVGGKGQRVSSTAGCATGLAVPRTRADLPFFNRFTI